MGEQDPRIAFFDRHAATWDVSGPPVAATLARLERLRPLLPIAPGSEVLEVGCGTGAFTEWLAQLADPGAVTAVDFSPEMIERARARGVRAEFRCVDVCSDALGFERFDVALCLNSFPHFRDPGAALRNLSRALMQDGSLLVIHLDSWEKINAFHASIGGPVEHDLLPGPHEWEPLLKAAEFRIAELHEAADLFYLRAARH